MVKKSGLTLVSNKVKDTDKASAASPSKGDAAKAIKPSKPADKVDKNDLPSFEKFSKIMGASTLIELLEASAAYMSLVLGKSHYSEKQISANLPPHIKRIVKEDERVGTLDRLNKRGFVEARNDGTYAISMGRKAAYQKKYLAG